jgi:fructose-1,6-bisphosphatase I
VKVNRDILTLEEFRKQELRFLPQATGELSHLLRDIALAAKRVNGAVNKAGLVDILGSAGCKNIQGEEVQRLDEFANSTFITALQRGVSCAGVVSEELENFIPFDDVRCRQSKYVVVMDPLDGSSNIDVNVSIGTLFGVYKRLTEKGTLCTADDFLQPGRNLVAAGYILYGPSTLLVYATKRGVNGFTLDPSIGEFTISHPNIQCPRTGKIYSVNHGNYFEFDHRVKAFILSCQQKPASGGGACTHRYTGSLVADMHRNLLLGGIFLYPSTEQYKCGKLRLVYECNPLAFIFERAAARSTNGAADILDLQPVSLHQRTPFFSGSREMMDLLSLADE